MWHLNILILTFALIWSLVDSKYENGEFEILQLTFLEGEFCKNQNNPGICRQVNNCPTAQQRRTFKTLSRCGFDGNILIICCPNIERIDEFSREQNDGIFPKLNETVSPKQNERISTIECKKMEKEVPTVISHLIIGGAEAKLGDFPHMVALGYKPRDLPEIGFYCGGTLISKRFVLTAAHCVYTNIANLTTARLGEISLTVNNTAVSDFGIEKKIVHPNYTSSYTYHDIALLKLNRDVSFTMNMYPACLHNDLGSVIKSMTITGWGQTNDSKIADIRSTVLLKASVSSVNTAQCDTFYPKLSRRNPHGLGNGQLCAVNQTADTCPGDSGGPLQIKHPDLPEMFSVVGITSFGKKCYLGIPGVYTKVAAYLDWIESEVWPQN